MYKHRAFVTNCQEVPSTLALSSQGIRHHFMAWLPQGVIGPKVQGFIQAHDAQVLDAEGDFVRLQIGQRRLLPWGRYGDDFPVELTISLDRQTACARSLTHVIAELRPLARVPHQALQQRLCQVLRALRYSLLAQELELA